VTCPASVFDSEKKIPGFKTVRASEYSVILNFTKRYPVQNIQSGFKLIIHSVLLKKATMNKHVQQYYVNHKNNPKIVLNQSTEGTDFNGYHHSAVNLITKSLFLHMFRQDDLYNLIMFFHHHLILI
jgi:hypothetical protein